MHQVLLAGVPIATLLDRLRTPSGDRMPEDVTKIVASFVPRSLSFGSFPFPRSGALGALSLDEMRDRIHRFIGAGEFTGYTDFMADDIGYADYDVMRAYGIEILMAVGLEDRVRLQSIFAPPVVGIAQRRAAITCLWIWMALRIIHSRWVREHGPSPAASVFHDEMEAWYTLYITW
jgi:hypothetical protein